MLQGVAGSRKGAKDAICQSLREIDILWTASLMYLLFLFFLGLVLCHMSTSRFNLPDDTRSVW